MANLGKMADYVYKIFLKIVYLIFFVFFEDSGREDKLQKQLIQGLSKIDNKQFVSLLCLGYFPFSSRA